MDLSYRLVGHGLYDIFIWIEYRVDAKEVCLFYLLQTKAMKKIETSILIDATVEDVWRVLSEFKA